MAATMDNKKGYLMDCLLKTEKVYVTTPRKGSMEINSMCLEDFRVKMKNRCGDNIIGVMEQAIRLKIDQTWKNRKQAFLDLKKIGDSHKTEKRSLTNSIPLIGSMLMGGLFMWETHKVSNHLQQVEGKFQNFKESSEAFNKETIKFENDIVKMVHTLDNKYDSYINRLDCTLRHSTLLNLWIDTALTDWTVKLDSLFKNVMEGSLSGKPMSTIVTRALLNEIINTNELLNVSAYKYHPQWALQSSILTMVDAVEVNNTYMIHYLLALPLFHEEHLHSIYDVRHTTFKANDTCLLPKVPKQVMKIGKNYFPFDIESAERKGQFYFTMEINPNINDIFDEQMATCINNISSTCTLKPTLCETNFIYTRAGLLIRIWKIMGKKELGKLI